MHLGLDKRDYVYAYFDNTGEFFVSLKQEKHRTMLKRHNCYYDIMVMGQLLTRELKSEYSDNYSYGYIIGNKAFIDLERTTCDLEKVKEVLLEKYEEVECI